MRVLEILELGDGLRRQAEAGCGNVNAAHHMVHEVMLRAFGDAPELVAPGLLREELSSRLAVKLDRFAAGHA